jgi:hypothetical protein
VCGAAGIGIAHQNWNDEHSLKRAGVTPREKREVKEERRAAYELLKMIHRQGRLKLTNHDNQGKPTNGDKGRD